MLTNAQEKLIISLHTKKGRNKTGLCLIEGQKFIKDAKKDVDFVFSREDTKNFDKLVSTQTPQDIAAVAKIPKYTLSDVKKSKIILVLDGVQDPGNVGTILRLCLGFNAGLILVESADASSPKVVRSSATAFFSVPWLEVPRTEISTVIKNLQRPIYKMEKRIRSQPISSVKHTPLVLIAGSEGNGIKIDVPSTSLVINHDEALESLNVATATAIVLHYLYSN